MTVMRLLILAVTPALVILAALLATFTGVGHVEAISDPLPWDFVAAATGVTLLLGVAAAWAER